MSLACPHPIQPCSLRRVEACPLSGLRGSESLVGSGRTPSVLSANRYRSLTYAPMSPELSSKKEDADGTHPEGN
jgi:hypothetical protein